MTKTIPAITNPHKTTSGGRLGILKSKISVKYIHVQSNTAVHKSRFNFAVIKHSINDAQNEL